MTIQELMPFVKQLTRADKLRLIHSLLYELAQEEGIDLPEVEQLLLVGKSYPVWSPHTAFTAADTLLELLETDSADANAQVEPLVVTENGRLGDYLISIELFDALMAQLEATEVAELVTNIAVGEQQFAQGAYKTIAEAKAVAEAARQNREPDE